MLDRGLCGIGTDSASRIEWRNIAGATAAETPTHFEILLAKCSRALCQHDGDFGGRLGFADPDAAQKKRQCA